VFHTPLRYERVCILTGFYELFVSEIFIAYNGTLVYYELFGQYILALIEQERLQMFQIDQPQTWFNELCNISTENVICHLSSSG
jgi:hypothetical protein